MNKKVAQIICKAWNTLDANVLEPYLSDDFEYASVWDESWGQVLDSMNHGDRYLIHRYEV